MVRPPHGCPRIFIFFFQLQLFDCNCTSQSGKRTPRRRRRSRRRDSLRFVLVSVILLKCGLLRYVRSENPGAAAQQQGDDMRWLCKTAEESRLLLFLSVSATTARVLRVRQVEVHATDRGLPCEASRDICHWHGACGSRLRLLRGLGTPLLRSRVAHSSDERFVTAGTA